MAGLFFVLLITLPPLLLILYGILSLILFTGSAGFRDFVSLFPTNFPWLADVFPILHKVDRGLVYRKSSLTVGYFYHLYFVALAVFVAFAFGHVVGFRSMQHAVLAGLRLSVRVRKMFDDRGNAFVKIAFITGCALLVLAECRAGWVGEETGRAFRRWQLELFPFVTWPVFFGALPAWILYGVHMLVAIASAEAKTMLWGVDAVREEAALKASGKNRDQP